MISTTRASDAHPPTTVAGRPVSSTEPEQITQVNLQKFQMHIHTVIDHSSSDEVRLTNLQAISECMEILSSAPHYPSCVELLVKNFLRFLIETETVFLVPSNAQTIRRQIIELFHRLPINDVLRNFVKEILSQMLKLLMRENEENALVLLRIIVEYMKQFRPQMINEVRDFLQFIHNVYRQKATVLDQMFLNTKLSFPNSTINEIPLVDLIDQICSPVQITVKKATSTNVTDLPSNSPAPNLGEMFTILPRSSNSVKLLAEFPVAIVLLYQLCRQFLQAEFGELVPLFLKHLALSLNKEQKSDPKFNIEVYIEFLTTQAKTLSFLAFVGKTYQEQLTSHSELLVTALLQLLEGCPPENVQLRKDIIVAARHFLSTDFRVFFTAHVRRFFDETLLLSTGYTARETLKPLAYNTFADFFNHIRLSLTIEDVQSVLYMYSKMIHDSSLPPTIQVMSLKFLSNLPEVIRQKAPERSLHLLTLIVEILVFKCKSLAKQCAHLLSSNNDKNSTTIPTINEIDVNNSSLNDLIQNLNEISNRDKEVQRQQFALVRFQATSPLVFTLSAADGRTLLKVLLGSLRHITWIVADAKLSPDNVVTQTKQFPLSLTVLYIKFFKYILQCLTLFFDPSLTSNTNPTRTKEEKEIMDMIASIFFVVNKQNYREIFQTNLSYFYNCAMKNPNITAIMTSLLQQSPSSTVLVELLLEFLLPRIHEIGETNNSNNACLKLFKLVINSVVSTNAANEHEKILQPYLKQIVLRSIECAQTSNDPYNYFILLRALFRSIGVGNHELLNQEFLTLLNFLLQRLNEYQSCQHRQQLRELFIELCLTVPVRLSVLLPYLPLLMEPLVNALNGSPTLILQGLRTLELCVDNLQPDFLYNHILPVRSSLMMSLYRLLSHNHTEIAQNTFRILGKLGGNNRRIMNEAQKMKTNESCSDSVEENEIFLQMSFENESKSISVPLIKLLRICCEQLKSSINDQQQQQQQIKRQAWLIVRSVLSVVLSIDEDFDLLSHFVKDSTFVDGQISRRPTIWKGTFLQGDSLAHDFIIKSIHLGGISKSLSEEVLPILKATIQHYTLVSVSFQTGPLSEETYQVKAEFDVSMILIDNIVDCCVDMDEDLNEIGRSSFETMINTLSILFDNDFQRISQLPMIDYLVERLFDQCHEPNAHTKHGACRFLSQLCLKTFSKQTTWLKNNLRNIVEHFIDVIISLTDEICSGSLRSVSTMIENLLEHFGSLTSSEGLDEKLVELFINYIFSPISFVRNLVFQSLRQLSQIYQLNLTRMIEPLKKYLIEKFSAAISVPLKNQAVIYQITFLDVYIFFRSLEPKLCFSALFDEELFKDLTKFVFVDDNELSKFPVYRCLTQQQCLLNLVQLKKVSIKTIGEFSEQHEYRERVIRCLYRMLIHFNSKELQTVVFETIEKNFPRHQNEMIRNRWFETYLNHLSFFDNEKASITLQTAQTLFFFSKLSPNLFDDRLSEQIFTIVRKLLSSVANSFRVNFDPLNQLYKMALIYLEILASLPNLSKRIIEPLTVLILKFDRHLMIESSSACRKHLIDLLTRHPQFSLDQFVGGENRLQDGDWIRLFLDILRSPSSSAIQAFVRTNWHDRFRQILSDQIVPIETSSTIQPIVCLTIRSLSILGKNDPVWWSSQHELFSLLLRLWRSKTFQQHSFVHAEHFDSFCSKELNNVLNLCLIYYQHHPERTRLLLELTKIYACPEKLFYPKKFFTFVQEVLIKTFSFKWKREALISFISLRSDESYTLECKSLFFEYILLPSFTYEFEHNRSQITDESFQTNNPDETIIDLFIRTLIDPKYLQQIHDKYRISLLRFLCLFLEYFPHLISQATNSGTTTNKRDADKIRRLMECTYGTLINNTDSTYKCQAHLLLCYIISRFPIVKKIIVNVFNSLLKSFMIDAKYLVRQATDLLIPAIPQRMDDGYECLANSTKKILSDDAHGNLQLIHIMSIIVRHQSIYFNVRYQLASSMIQAAQKIAGQQSNSFEHKKLAIDIVDVLIRWELRKHHENLSDQRGFTKQVVDAIFIFLIRHACQVSLQSMLPLSNQCIRLFKIARKFAWPNFDVKLGTFERLIHQIETANPSSHNSIGIAIDLLAFLISTFSPMQIKYTIRQMKRSLINCVSITSSARLVESMQNLFSKLIVQIPIEPPMPNPTTVNSPSFNQQLVQATLASLTTGGATSNTPPLQPAIVNKNDEVENFYAVITKTIIETMNNAAMSMVNTSENGRTSNAPNGQNLTASNGNAMQNLPLAFGYLKIIEKQQPKYVDKLTLHITKLLQKLIKDHTSAAAEFNPGYTEYIIECLTLLKYRIGQLNSDLRKQFMNNFLPCLIEKSHDITLVRAIIRLVFDWLKWRGDVQLVPSLKEKSQLLLRLLQCIEKSSRFQNQTSNNEPDLTNSFLELILHVYQESNYRELSIKLEAAFVLGLKSTNQQLRKEFFLILDKNLRKTLHDRLLFIFLSQNWEYLGQHYWIKQCLELFYSCASTVTPLSVMDNRRSILPSITSVIKSGEFYDRYDFLIDFIKTKNPSAIESSSKKNEANLESTIKSEPNDETSTKTGAFSIISNALSVTAMSTLVTKKQRSSSISLNEPKAKHFKPTISFENIRRLSTEKSTSIRIRSTENENQLEKLIEDEINFMKNLISIRSKPTDLFESILQFLHTNNNPSIDQLAHHLFVDLLPKIIRNVGEKYRSILFQQVLQPFFVSGTHLQQRELQPYSSLNTLLEAFSSMFTTQQHITEFVQQIRPIVLKYIGKAHNTWHRSILLLENYILEKSSNQETTNNDETFIEALNSLSELYEHLNEDDYNIGLWLQRKLPTQIKKSISNGLQYEQMSLFPQALECYNQAIKDLDREKSIASTTPGRFSQLDEYSFLEQRWIKCTKELNQWSTLMNYCKQQSNRDHLLYLECSWRSENWPLMKETLGQLDAMCNGTNMNLSNTSLQTLQFLTQNPALSSSTIMSNILTIKDFQWKLALYRCYLNLCSTVNNTEDPGIYQTTMNITDRLIDYCSLSALKEWKHLPNCVGASHWNLLQASQRIIELQESQQILSNLQNNVNASNANSTAGVSTTTTNNVRSTASMHELKTIVKTWKSRLPLINDPLSFWNDVFTWRELQYAAISSQFDKEANSSGSSTSGHGNNSIPISNTNQVLLGIHAIAQSITQMGKIARKHQMPSVALEILSKIGTVIPSVPVVDSYQRIKQVLKCYLMLIDRFSVNEIQEVFDLIEQANTKYFNRDMMSEFYSLKGVALTKENRFDEAEKCFSCASQLSENNLPRIWLNWSELFEVDRTKSGRDESLMTCYLNACRDLPEIKARSVLSKVFFLLSRENEDIDSNRLSLCVERFLSSIPVQHWLFWLPVIVKKLMRNESTAAMIGILNELIRHYPQPVYVEIRRARELLSNVEDEQTMDTTSSNENAFHLPKIPSRKRVLNNFRNLEKILFEQNPSVVGSFQILIDQLKTINETFLEYAVRRLYQCQRSIYEDLHEKKSQISAKVEKIFSNLFVSFEKNEKPLSKQFFDDFNGRQAIDRSLLIEIEKWINLLECRIEQTEPSVRFLRSNKYLDLICFHSQISNEINVPGELSQAPSANFFFRINKIFSRLERVMKNERFFQRLTIRTHNGQILRYLLSNQFESIELDNEDRTLERQQNTEDILKMLNNVVLRKDREVLKRNFQFELAKSSIFLQNLKIFQENRSKKNLIEIFDDRTLKAVRKHFLEFDEENPLKTFRCVENEFFLEKDLLKNFLWRKNFNPTELFSFRKIFTNSIGFFSALNFLLGFEFFALNKTDFQLDVGNLHADRLIFDAESINDERKILLTSNIEHFINKIALNANFSASILATFSAIAKPKFRFVDSIEIFIKEDLHLKHPDWSQSQCLEHVERIVDKFHRKLQQFHDFDRSKQLVAKLVENSNEVQLLCTAHPLLYPWL